MYLVTAATEFEMQPFSSIYPDINGVHRLVSGIGPLETAVRLFSWLNNHAGMVSGVIHFGVAGAYTGSPGVSSPELLDICLAEREVLGDLGICFEERIAPFLHEKLNVKDRFSMNSDLLGRAARALDAENISFYTGVFVTVNCSSGSAGRAAMLAAEHHAICENMEGAAVARVCEELSLPCLEARCVSNMVGDRDPDHWQLEKACTRAAEAAAHIVGHLEERPDSAERK